MHLLRFMLVMTAVSATSVTAQVRRSIQAVGTASVSAQPDRIKVDIGVTTMANTAQEASNENATTMSAVQNQIRQVLGPGADIQTIGYSITPNYKYTQGAPPVLMGYTATHTVEVTTGDKDSIVKVIDSVGQSGATSITGLRFAISNDEPLREQALAAASKQALSHAQAIAKGLRGTDRRYDQCAGRFLGDSVGSRCCGRRCACYSDRAGIGTGQCHGDRAS